MDSRAGPDQADRAVYLQIGEREEQFRFGDAVAADSNQDFRSFTSGTTQLSIIILNGF